MFKFELRYHFTQLSFIIAATLFLILGCFSAVNGGFGGSEVHRDSPYVITNIIALFSLLTIFAGTLCCANVVLRDTIYKMDSVLYTTSITKKAYFFVRFLGLLLTVFTLLVCAILGIYIGTLFVDGSELGTFNLLNYLHPLLVFGLPNVLFACSLIFCTAVLTKNVRAIYVAGVSLYILYMAASILGNSPLLATSVKVNDPGILPFLIDPFGLASFFSETRSWTDLQRNQHLFPVKGIFLFNRLLWLGFSALIITISYRFFNFRLQSQSQQKQKKQAKISAKLIPFRHFNVFPKGLAYAFSSFKSQFKLEVISLFKHIPFMVMMLLWIFIFAIELKDTILYGAYGIKFYPTTGAIIEEMRAMKFALILLVFYAAELINRERTSNIQSLIYSTPVNTTVLWGAKCLTLAVLVISLVSANILIGISLQIFNGYFEIEIAKYLSLYYYSAFALLLFIVLIVFIQNLVTNKYLGMLLSMVVVFACAFSTRLGIEHFLLRFASVPDLQFSYFNGFGHYAKAFNWYMLYWSGFAVVLSVLTIGMWQGSLQLTFLDRLKSLPRSVYKLKFIALVGVVIWISCAAFIYQQTNVIGNYKSKQEALDWNINYEKKYKAFDKLPQPIIKSIKTTVDLFTDENRYEVKGTYQLKNETNKPIAKLWVTLHQAVNSFEIRIPNATAHPIDKTFNQQFIDLKTPLKPVEELKMDFSLSVIRSGFVPFDTENSVVSNGAYIELEKFVPHFGYNPNLEIDDNKLRKKEGLPSYQISKEIDLKYHLIDLETTISTASDQQVVTVGTLQKSWKANDRSYFKYKTTVPINFMFALSSAKYQLKKENYKGLTLSVYYQLGHEYNVKTMFKAIKDALDYGNTNFSAYPLKQFTLAEIPHYKGAATAYPGVVFNAERINYLTDFRDEHKVNQSYAITTHEIAHQWWANSLAPADAMGYAMLTESLAKYTEAMLLEKNFGKMYLSDYLKDDNNLYFAYRNPNEKELPLAKTYGQNHVHYQKGGLVMYGVKEALGEEVVNGALSKLIATHANPHQRAVTQDLIGTILNLAPEKDKKFIDESFNEVVDYDLKLKVLACKRLVNGKFSIDLQINGGKHKQGDKTLLTPDMDIDIAFFSKAQLELNRYAKPTYFQKHRINKLQTKLNIVVDQKPKTIALDPYAYLLDANLKDNMQELK
ncbi:ABC transporter permease/M1 family aminopeptidase [Pedobacter polaris]|nr:M1 family aminopeptidase [Pedobacter polaris]